MLVVKKKQMEEFTKKSVEDFVNRMINHLKKNYSEKFSKQPKEEWVKWLENKIDEAQRYEISREPEVAEFIELSFCYNELNQLPKPKWLSAILNQPNSRAKEKVKMIVEHLNFR